MAGEKATKVKTGHRIPAVGEGQAEEHRKNRVRERPGGSRGVSQALTGAGCA